MNDDISELLGEELDPNSVEPQERSDFQPIPPDTYLVQIDNAEIVETKGSLESGSHDCYRLKLELTILEGDHANRKIFDSINIRHSDPKTQEGGRRDLAGLGQALGLLAVKGTDQLVNKTVKVRTRIKPAKGGYPADAAVRSYAPASGLEAAPPPRPGTQAARPAPAPATAGSRTNSPTARPWEKKKAPAAAAPAEQASADDDNLPF